MNLPTWLVALPFLAVPALAFWLALFRGVARLDRDVSRLPRIPSDPDNVPDNPEVHT